MVTDGLGHQPGADAQVLVIRLWVRGVSCAFLLGSEQFLTEDGIGKSL